MARAALYTLIFLVGAAVHTSTASSTLSSKYDENNAFFAASPVERIMANSITVMVKTGRKPSLQLEILGGGVIVKAQRGLPLQIITVTHVATRLDNGNGVVGVVYGAGTSLYAVRPIKECAERDLALLETIDTWDGPDIAAKMAGQSPVWGEQVWIVGAPAGAERTLALGILANKVQCARSTGSCYKTDAELYFGSSGGGVFNQKGRLVGIADYVTVDYVEDRNGARHPVITPGGGGVISWHTVGKFLEENGIR